MAPIYKLMFGKNNYYKNEPSLELTEDQVAISYKSYRSADPRDMKVISDQKLAPGKSQNKSWCEKSKI